ncbi:DUF7261 family protein [Halanaeroarchaeum sulfurireducens]|uniref:Uncharacterized protein n=1 Tax=Halanaeroarchaeum sulfurireducens TaxID=1604004 RepID=A0A0F7PC03_9EURY|nr:hypothetical protein [Halanaeroarchaeum sulfurireducens]AKH97675.1 hypothetical protein HLASF_1188 [Halanaeroarchaeum sulfurireducens]
MHRSRGQVILVAALGIAVTLVALALITNTAIYTENLATRETVSGQDAIAFQQSMDAGATGLLALANRYNATPNSEDHASIHDRFQADLDNLNAAAERESARHGELATVSLVDTTNGTRISQSETRNFTNADGNESWTIASDVEQIRRFEMNVTPNASTLTVIVSDGSGNEWTADVADGGTDSVDVTLSNESNSTTCTVANESAVVDLTQGTVGGQPCDGPAFGSNVDSPYDVSFRNGDAADGRFVVFVDRDPGGVTTTQYPDTMSADAAIYDATIHVSVRQPDLTYETNVTVAPTESPEGDTYGIVP